MERANSNFNLFDFDVEGFARAYYQQQPEGRQSDEPVQQTGFEEHLGELQLGPSSESSSEAASPAARPGRGGAAIRRPDVGGSMRMPSREDNTFSRTRHSVDIPETLPQTWTQERTQSALRDDLFNSARYSFPSEAQDATNAKGSKKRGLWSRIKSGVGKAFGASGSEKSSGAPEQPGMFSTRFRVDYARQPGRNRGGPVPAADEALIEDFRNRAAGNLSDGTIKNAAGDLRHLSARLNANGRPSIADRIRRELENAQLDDPEVGNHQLEAELDEDVDAYANDRGRRIKAALKKLREFGAGNALEADLRRLVPHRADATLIRMWAAAEKATHRVEPETIDRLARRLFRLSDWLRSSHRSAIADRLFTAGLTQDVEEYRQETGDGKINADLLRLGRYQQVLEANRALGLNPPEDAASPAGQGGPEASSPQELPATPATPSAGAWNWLGEQIHGPTSSLPPPHLGSQASLSQGIPGTPATPSAGAWDWFREQMHGPASPSPAPQLVPHPNLSRGLPASPQTPSQGAWDWFGQQMQEPASSSWVRRPSSNIYGDLESLVDLNPPTPYELRDDARSAPAPEFGGAPSFAGSSGAAQELRDIGTIVGPDWRHGSQPATDVLVDVLGNINLLPNQFGPSQFAINGERYSATFGPGGRRDVRLIHHPRAYVADEAGPSSRPMAPSDRAGPSVQSLARSRESVPDLGFLIRGGWQHHERFLPDYLVRALEGERLMPAVGRPTYINIREVPYRAELVQTDGGPRVRVYPELG
ncbi:hypothetical protein [Bradyrhizobium sp. STM 3562]|uniref:hypothetical protein n=1 Tax=Bradyrhizobium sp. STM 3562 TaxID=578924 RepID=UPI003890CB9F